MLTAAGLQDEPDSRVCIGRVLKTLDARQKKTKVFRFGLFTVPTDWNGGKNPKGKVEDTPGHTFVKGQFDQRWLRVPSTLPNTCRQQQNACLPVHEACRCAEPYMQQRRLHVHLRDTEVHSRRLVHGCQSLNLHMPMTCEGVVVNQHMYINESSSLLCLV